MRKLIYFSIACILPALHCATVTVDAPSVCDSKEITKMTSIGNLPFTQGSAVYFQPVDVSGALSKVNEFANVSVNILDFSINNSTGDLSWVNRVQVFILPSTYDIAFMREDNLVTVKDYTLTPEDKASSTINLLPLKIDTSTLYDYLRKDAVNFIFTMDGTTAQKTPTLGGTICMSASASAEKSL